MTRCQACGRRLGLTKAGTIRFHNVRGVSCLGAGFPPIERDDARLVELVAEAVAADRACTRELIALIDARVNRIEPHILERSHRASQTAGRLSRRLTRHRSWPARFEREMETRGWGDPPPDYLLRPPQ